MCLVTRNGSIFHSLPDALYVPNLKRDPKK